MSLQQRNIVVVFGGQDDCVSTIGSTEVFGATGALTRTEGRPNRTAVCAFPIGFPFRDTLCGDWPFCSIMRETVTESGALG